MSRLAQPPLKFTHSEWNISNQLKYATSEGERIAAERLIDESFRAIEDTHQTTTQVQKDVNKKLSQRVDEMRYWETEAENYLETIKDEIVRLVAFRSRLEKAMEACKEPLHISQQCLAARQKRRGVDLAHDDAEKELLKEVEVIEGAMVLLSRTMEQATEQLRLNRKVKYNLEKDIKDKSMSIAIDNHNSELTSNSKGNQFKPGVTKVCPNSTSREEWMDFTNTNIWEAEKQRQTSKAMRTVIDGLLQATTNDMQRQKDSTDDALQRRVSETRDSKEKLEDHLRRVKKQITEMEDNIARLLKAIADKEAGLKLCHTRLDNRSFRPGIELTRDTPQYRLIEESVLIGQAIDTLQERLASSRCSLIGLDRKRVELEEELAIKSNTLFIDEVECLEGMRKSICLNPF